MFMTASEALSTEFNCESSDENIAMPAIMSSKSSSSSLLSQKRSAASASAADCYNMSLGAGPLWWS